MSNIQKFLSALLAKKNVISLQFDGSSASFTICTPKKEYPNYTVEPLEENTFRVFHDDGNEEVDGPGLLKYFKLGKEVPAPEVPATPPANPE